MQEVAEREPELKIIIQELAEVTEQLEGRGRDLMAFEPKVSSNGVQAANESDKAPQPPSGNYVTELRSILGRLRSIDETLLTPSVDFLRSFL